MFKSGWSKVVAGIVIGAVGIPMLKTRTARTVYKYVTAGAMIAKDSVLAEAERVQSAAVDIGDDAKTIVENYYSKKDAEFEQAKENVEAAE